jgi:nucleotide-binding universal stress UspA family protein
MDGRERILVGVDGSEGSDRALRWAVRTAVARRASLQVIGVYADERLTVPAPMYGVVSGDTVADMRHATEQVVHEAARYVAELAPDLPTSAFAVPGRPAAELAERACGATMLVVGSRELKTIGSAVLGSVSCRVVTKSEPPVIVVRGADTDAGSIDSSGRWRPAGAVVAGIDGRSNLHAILRFAFEHASRVGIDLRLVSCAYLPEYVPEYWGPPPDPRTKAEIHVAEALAGWRQDYPDVQVSSSVIAAHPTEGLLEESEGQALLVIGARTHHPVLDSMIGSVSQGVLHHARCPVAVIPNEPASGLQVATSW